MKSFKFFIAFITILASNLFIGCLSDDIELEGPQAPLGEKTIPLNFEGVINGYDGESKGSNVNNRATTASWANGDILYITFYNGSNIITGMATYNSVSGWSVSYEGDLAVGNGQKCEVRHFVDVTQATEFVVTLNPHSQIYEDLDATYSYNNGSLTVTATLTPKLGRMRFTGNEGENIHLTGFTTCTSFTPTNNSYYTTKQMVETEVASTKTTPYIYATFTESDYKIGVIGSDYAFTRTCSKEMLEPGESGYMAIPSDAAHNNWRTGLYITASGVEFKMIPVSGYSSGFYLIGETEVTEALYKSVNGTTNTSLYPQKNISYNTITSWISKLSNLKELNFSLPSSGQWKYAAKGGNKSLGYTYSGSNSPGDIGWYSDNSEGTVHQVKQKAPNELGIYDMSGNVAEYTLYNGTYTYLYGGDYDKDKSYLDTDAYTNYISTSYTDNHYGFRIILKTE